MESPTIKQYEISGLSVDFYDLLKDRVSFVIFIEHDEIRVPLMIFPLPVCEFIMHQMGVWYNDEASLTFTISR